VNGRDGNDALSDRLVQAAIRLLKDEGPSAVQARRLAREVDASTIVVYHYFGGMPRMLRAVCDEGFRLLDQALGAVPVTEEPVVDIIRQATAYRATARHNPHLYDLMFGLAAAGGHRPAESPPAHRAESGCRHLVAASARAVAGGKIRSTDPEHVAAQLWSLLHGFVILELAGHLDRFPDGVTEVLVPLGVNLLAGLGADPEYLARCAAETFDDPDA
jgi:AcrR family transcriptional regulator